MFNYGYGYYGLDYMIYILPGMLLAMYAQAKISGTYDKYSRVQSGTGLSGSEMARKILDNNGLHDVEIRMIQGKLTDNYNPANRVLSLSREVYSGTSIASVAIASHEVGHAIQHKERYVPLALRNFLVPAASIGSYFSMGLIIAGAFFSNFLVQLGIALFSLAVLFQVITLPVEYDASNRAKEALSRELDPQSQEGAKNVLSAAALTYVAATIVAIGQLLRLLAIFGRRRD